MEHIELNVKSVESLQNDSFIEKETDSFKYNYILKILNSNEEEDGGSDWDLVIQRKSDLKYFRANYNDWDLMDEGTVIRFEEVEKKEKLITVYE